MPPCSALLRGPRSAPAGMLHLWGRHGPCPDMFVGHFLVLSEPKALRGAREWAPLCHQSLSFRVVGVWVQAVHQPASPLLTCTRGEQGGAKRHSWAPGPSPTCGEFVLESTGELNDQTSSVHFSLLASQNALGETEAGLGLSPMARAREGSAQLSTCLWLNVRSCIYTEKIQDQTKSKSLDTPIHCLNSECISQPTHTSTGKLYMYT